MRTWEERYFIIRIGIPPNERCLSLDAFGMLFVYDEPCRVRRNARKNIRKKDVEADITRRLVLRSMRQIRRRDSRAAR